MLTEVIHDSTIAFPPLNRLLARRLMEETKVYQALKGFRNQPPANLDLLEEILIRLTQLMTDFAEIEELDINPLFITGDGFRAVDARARLKRVEVRAPMHLVISPYPDQYETRATTRGLIKIFIRPIRNWDFSAVSARRQHNILSPRAGMIRRTPCRHQPRKSLFRDKSFAMSDDSMDFIEKPE